VIKKIWLEFYEPDSLWIHVDVDADCWAQRVFASLYLWSEKEKRWVFVQELPLSRRYIEFRVWYYARKFKVALKPGAYLKVFARAICENCRLVIDAACFTVFEDFYEEIRNFNTYCLPVDCRDLSPLECPLPSRQEPGLGYDENTGIANTWFNNTSLWKAVEVKWYLWDENDWVLKATHVLGVPVFADTYEYGALNPGDKIRVEIRGQCKDDMWSPEMWEELEI